MFRRRPHRRRRFLWMVPIAVGILLALCLPEQAVIIMLATSVVVVCLLKC